MNNDTSTLSRSSIRHDKLLPSFFLAVADDIFLSIRYDVIMQSMTSQTCSEY